MVYWTYDPFSDTGRVLNREARERVTIAAGGIPRLNGRNNHVLTFTEHLQPLDEVRQTLNIQDDVHKAGVRIARTLFQHARQMGGIPWLVVQNPLPEVASRKATWALTLMARAGVMDHVHIVLGETTTPVTTSCDPLQCPFAHGFVIPITDTRLVRSIVRRAAMCGEAIIWIPLYRVPDAEVAITRAFSDAEMIHIIRHRLVNNTRHPGD